MAVHEEHTLVLTRLTERRLQPTVIERNRDGIVAGVNNKSLYVSGWLVTSDEQFHNETVPEDSYDISTTIGWRRVPEMLDGNNWKFQIVLNAIYHREDNRPPDMRTFRAICRKVNAGAAQPKVGRWELTEVDGEDYEEEKEEAGKDVEFVEYTPVSIPPDWRSYFDDHLFGLDHQYGMVMASLFTAVDSGWEKRFHPVLIGPPGSGKTDICRTVKKMLGDDAVLEYDATAMTAAGVIKELSEIEILPRCIVIEEIEKADPASLAVLLALLDQRSEIRKTTARSFIQRDTKLWAIATVNNYPLFQKIASGALASRFSHPVFFTRPTRTQLEMILDREVDSIKGSRAWVKPTLDYCAKHHITDPRRATAICLCGRDELLTGQFQVMLEATSHERILEEQYEELEEEIDLDIDDAVA